MSMISVISGSGKSVPGAPTIGTATDVGTGRAYNNGAATVTFTAPTYNGRTPITSYTVTSSPGSFTASGASSPLTVTGLQSGTSYTFTVTATNAIGTSAASSASNSITATTVPQAPTIGTATKASTTSVTVAYTANATGGKTVSAYTATSSPGSITGTGASPITVSGLTTGTAYTFTVTATNANGTSAASAASNSVTPGPSLSTWTASTNYPAVDSFSIQVLGGMMSNTAGNFQIWAGAGIASGSFSTNRGYYLESTGNSWVLSNYPHSAYGPGIQRILGTAGAATGGYNFGSSQALTSRAYMDGVDWLSVTPTYPVANSFTGLAATSGGFRYAGGENSGNSYYQGALNTAFTATTAFPGGATGVYAIDNGSYNGNMYFFSRTSGGSVYYLTSLTSGWTALGTQPTTGGNDANVYSNNTYTLVSWKNRADAMYQYNTSTGAFTNIGGSPVTGYYGQSYSRDGLIRTIQKSTANVAGVHYYASYS